MTVALNRPNQSRTQLMAALTRVPTESRRANRSRRRVTAVRLLCRGGGGACGSRSFGVWLRFRTEVFGL